MKKILVSLMLLVMTALSAHAQFEKEVWYVNASLTGLDLSHSKNEGTNFGFALTGGAFVADNVAVLLNFKGNYVEHGMDETSIGAQGRYYFSSCGIYGGLGMAYKHLSCVGFKKNLVCLTPEVGYAFFLGRNVTIEHLILALIIRCVGVKRVMRFLPPVVTGPIIICIGLSLAPSAVSNASTNWLIAIVALAVIIIFNIWGKGMFKIIPILLGVVISYVFALVLQGLGFTNPDGSVILNFSGVSSAAVVGLPPFILPKFNLTAILIMAPIAIATMMEHIGDISAISATVGQNFIEDPGLHRTLIGDGIATSISAMIGGPANTTYGENTGVLELSRVHDPKVVRLAACYAIVLSFIPKVAEIIASMPASIIGGVSFILYGMISAIGVRNVVENHVDFTKSRNLIIAGVILVSGLGFSDGLTFTIGSTSITLTSLAIAAIAGIVLNAILPGNDYAFGKDPEGDASRGVDLRPHELEQELKNQK